MSPGDRVQVHTQRACNLLGSDVAEVLVIGDGEAELQGPEGTCWEDTSKLTVLPVLERRG